MYDSLVPNMNVILGYSAWNFSYDTPLLSSLKNNLQYFKKYPKDIQRLIVCLEETQRVLDTQLQRRDVMDT